MQAIFTQQSVTFKREEGEPKYYGARCAAGEHTLFHNIAKWLNARGFAVIKKRAQTDGHMIGDEYQPYIRCHDKRKEFPHIFLYSGFYALRGANEDWNKGEVKLILTLDCWDQKQDTLAMIRNLAVKHADIHVKEN